MFNNKKMVSLLQEQVLISEDNFDINFQLKQKISRDFSDIINEDFSELINNDKADIEKKQQLVFKINAIIQEHGLGVGMLVVHQQGLKSGYLKPGTESVLSSLSFDYASVPVRKFRRTPEKLGIIADQSKPEYFHHGVSCNYCSGDRKVPKELVVDFILNGKAYAGGFTFAPFGNPDTAIHFLFWEKVQISDNKVTNDLEVSNMELSEDTFANLIEFTREINSSLQAYCQKNNLKFSPIEGIFNGWAGNSIYHQHFQFTSLDLRMKKASVEKVLIDNKFQKIEKLNWPTSVYRISSKSFDQLKDAAKKVSLIWKEQQDTGVQDKVLYKDGPVYTELITNHTQNLYVSWENGECVAYFIPRFREKVDYVNHENRMINGVVVPNKNNLAVLEIIGRFLVDEDEDYQRLEKMSAEELEEIANIQIGAIDPYEGILNFENTIMEKMK